MITRCAMAASLSGFGAISKPTPFAPGSQEGLTCIDGPAPGGIAV